MPLEKQDLFVSGQDGYHTYRIPSLMNTPRGTVLAFAERSTPDVVRAMMNDYFVTIAPVVEAEAGELVQTVGDQVFAVFRNPGHEQRAAQAAPKRWPGGWAA